MRLRWLGLALALTVGLAGSSAEAQVFKPKAKKTETTKKTSSAKKKKATPKKKAAARKKSKAATRARPDDLTPAPEADDADNDYVKIWDDDE